GPSGSGWSIAIGKPIRYSCTKAMEALFGRHELAVLGLHSVFEHHAAMGPQALAAFVHEYRIGFPMAIDQPDPDGPVPRTMARYRLRGTPTLMLFDREGRLRHSLFGHQHDMLVGSLVGRLLAEGSEDACDEGGCRLPGGAQV
ncbi:hypothetical protein, partial [uncultured Massilia sp.]|uniref:hypothetical protein n=1 Tax=uncultured Massilia sp. TaxID=169973 RepID=UPI0025839119